MNDLINPLVRKLAELQAENERLENELAGISKAALSLLDYFDCEDAFNDNPPLHRRASALWRAIGVEPEHVALAPKG